MYGETPQDILTSMLIDCRTDRVMLKNRVDALTQVAKYAHDLVGELGPFFCVLERDDVQDTFWGLVVALQEIDFCPFENRKELPPWINLENSASNTSDT